MGSLSPGILEASVSSLALGSPFPNAGTFHGLLPVTLGKLFAIFAAPVPSSAE